MGLGRWAGVGFLVAGLIGVNTAVAQADANGAVLDRIDVATLVSKPEAVGQALFNLPDSRAFSVAAEDDEDMDNEEVEEEFEEDGILPTGQSEQRAQKRNDRSETKNEDSGDTPSE